MTAPWDQRTTQEQARVEALLLSRWLPGVVATVPFHVRRHGEVDDRVLVDRTGLRRLAPSRERDLLHDAPGGGSCVLRPTLEQVKRFASSETLSGIARAIRRAGTTGERDALVAAYRPVLLHRGGVAGELLVASAREDLDRLHRAGARAAAVLGLRDDDVVLSAVPAGPTLAAVGSTHLAYGASLPALHARGHGTDLAQVARSAALVPATVLLVALEEALALADALGEARVEVRDVRTVVTVGPPPAAELRTRIAAAYDRLGAEVVVRALWGPSAGRSLWAECAEGVHGLHTTPDLEVLEVLDPLTGALSDADGDLTITSVGWHGTALVRFQTGTWVDPLTTEPCPGCGRTVPRLVGDLAPHAWEVPVRLEDARDVTADLRGVAAALAGIPGVRAWRAELLGPTDRVPRDRLHVEVAADAADAELRDLDRRIHAAVGVPVDLVTAVSADEVERSIAEVGGVLADRR